MKTFFKIVLWIIGVEALAYFSGISTESSIKDWYQNINKSPLTPPDFWFPIVWSILYAMIAVAGHFIWQAEKGTGKIRLRVLFFAQLLINYSWTPLFFYFHLVGTALIVVIILLAVLVSLIIQLLKNRQLAGLLLLPYTLWLCFATYLNYTIWIYN